MKMTAATNFHVDLWQSVASPHTTTDQRINEFRSPRHEDPRVANPLSSVLLLRQDHHLIRPLAPRLASQSIPATSLFPN